MWHTGSYQAFPARYGYITVFLGLIIAADMLNDFNQKNTVEKMSVKKNAVMMTVSVQESLWLPQLDFY